MINSFAFGLFFSLYRVFFAGLFFLYSGILLAAPEQASIQLKWEHSFQFAGYYAAIEKGYYREAGLEVSLKELDFSKDNVEQVIAGESEYGVSDSTLLIYHLKGKPVVLLKQFFQHSPLVFLSHRESGIISPYEMEGKSVAFNNNNLGDAALNTLLVNTLGNLSKINRIDYDKSYFQQFIDGKIDVIFAYTTNEPYLLKEQGIDVNIINPQSYGIDFYGDNLFTSRKELNEHPERVEKMMQATVKGWQYALDHSDEIIQLIRDKYNLSLSTDHLRYAARTTRQMIIPEMIEMGSIDPKRYQRIAQEYRRLGLTKTGKIEKWFFHKWPEQNSISIKLTLKEQAWLKAHPLIRVSAEPDWPPFDFLGDDGKVQGITIDYLSLAAKRLGVRLQFVTDGSWAERLEKLRRRELDAVGAITYSAERNEFLNFTRPYMNSPYVLATRTDDSAQGPEDLERGPVAVERGYITETLLREQYPDLETMLTENTLQALEAVSAGRAKAYAGQRAVISYLSRQHLITNLKIGDKFRFPDVDQRIAVRKDWPELAALFQKALDSISEDERRAILRRWISMRSFGEVPPKVELTSEEQRWLREHPIARVANEEDWPPYDFAVNGQPKGYSIDLIRLIAEKTGLELEFVNGYVWDELEQMAKAGGIDILPALWRTAERKKVFNFTRAYYREATVLVVRKGSSLSSIYDLEGRTLSVIRGFAVNNLVKQQFPDIRVLEFDDVNNALQAVSIGKADAYIASHGVANYIIQNEKIPGLQISDIITLTDQPEDDQLFMATPKQKPILASILQKGLDAVSADEKRQLQGRWKLIIDPTSSLSEDEPGFSLWIWAAATLFILVISVLFIVTQKIPDAVLVRYFGSGGFRLPALLVMTIIVILIGVAIHYTLQQNRRETLSQVQDNLTVTLYTVVHQMDSWVEERFNLLRQLGQHPRLVDISERLLKLPAGPDVLKASSELAEARQFFAEWEKKFGDSGFFVINPRMISIGSARDSNIGLRNLIAEQRPDLLKKAFAGETVFIPPIVSDLNRDDPARCGRVCMSMFFAAPIVNSENEIIAVLAQRLPSGGGLSKILRSGRIGDSGESYAFDTNGLLASESRFRGHLIRGGLLLPEQHEVGTIEVRDPGGNILQGYQTPTGKSQALTLMAKALIRLSEEGMGKKHSKLFRNIEGYNDYRGVPVFGSALWNFRLGIGITTEMDVDEALAGFHRMQISLLTIAVLLLLLFVSAIVFTLALAGRAGQIMRRSQDELETLVDERTNELQRSEQSLMTSNRRLALATQTISLGIWEWDLKAGAITWDARMFEIYGIPQTGPISRDTWKKAVHPDDLGKAYASLEKVMVQGGQDQVEYRIQRPDGSLRHIYSAQIVIKNDANKPVRMVGVNWDATKEKEAERALENAKEEAENANKAKSEFLANMSHEIRTPMNAILGFTELLDDQITEPRLSSFVKTIRSAGDTLLQLINDILDLSKIEAGKMDIQKTPSNVHELFTELGNIFTVTMRNKDLDFVLDIDPKIPQSLLLDATRLRQVLFNLIGNAVKFTNEGTIRLRACTDHEDEIRSKLDLVIDVEDTGVGIPQDQIKQIFAAFEQVDGQSQAKYGGTGLGLSISQRLTERMGGGISIVSQVGEGSTFTIKLRDVDVSAMIAAASNDTEQFGSNTIRFHPGLILVADDVRSNIGLLRENFRATELTVIEAGNGQEAVDLARLRKPDLILMDLRMPVMDGYQATEQIKSFLDVPVIALTASVMRDEFERAKSSQFDGYLRKPVLRADLFKALTRFLPYDQVEPDIHVEQQFSLSNEVLHGLPGVMKKLDHHSAQWQAAMKSNNITEISQFADDILDIGKKYSVTPLQDYATELRERIDSFDIAGIQGLLKKFPEIQKGLQRHLVI